MLTNQFFQSDVSLHAFTTFGIAALTRYYVHVTNVAQLHKVIQSSQFTDLPKLVLGGGSNLILTRDFSGIVLHIALTGREYIFEDEHADHVRAAAG